MAKNISAANTPTSSNPDQTNGQVMETSCWDPEHPNSPCPICGGMGWVKFDVPVEHPRFGKLYRCPNFPVEADIERRERLRRLSNLDTLRDKTFENFQQRNDISARESQTLKMAYDIAINYAHQRDGWLLLEGRYGSGKTHLAAAIGNWRLEQGDSVLFITAPDLLDHLRATYGPKSDTSYDEIFERIRTVELLIIDDLGSENPSAWAQEKLFQIFDYRYTRRLPMVVTSNVELERIDPRVSSRLQDESLTRRATMQVPDFRTSSAKREHDMFSRLGSYQHMTFESFEIQTALPEERDNLVRVLNAAKRFAQEPQNTWLLLMGGYGTGKTHLAAAIAHYRIELNDEVIFLTAADFIDYLRSTFQPDTSSSFDSVFDRIRNIPLLILDDLNSETGKGWAQERLFQLLDYRYLRRMPTIITTPSTVDELEKSHPRILSRLLDSRLCRNFKITTRSYATRIHRSR